MAHEHLAAYAALIKTRMFYSRARVYL